MRASLLAVVILSAGCESLVGVGDRTSDHSDASSAGTGGSAGIGASGATGGTLGGGTAGTGEGGSGGSSAVGSGGTGGAAGRGGGAPDGGSDAEAGSAAGTAGTGSAGEAGIDGPDGSDVPASECPREFDIPTGGSEPLALAAGPDGNVWFTENLQNKIGRIEPSGRITEFRSNTPRPVSISVGAGDALWYNAYNGSRTRIGRISIGGAIAEFDLGTIPPGCVTKGPDDNVWFTMDRLKIGRITPQGNVTFYDVPAPDGGLANWLPGITAHSDGKLWFIERSGPDLMRTVIISVTTEGIMQKYPLEQGSKPPLGFSITSGPDGALWFIERTGVGRLTTTGTYRRFFADASSSYVKLAFDQNGYIWLTDFDRNQIGRMSQQGAYVWFSLPHSNSGPNDITLGPDGNLWFVERFGNRIGRMNPRCR